MGRPRTPLTKEWLSSCILVAQSGCWEWQRLRAKYGYGKVSVLDKATPAHRAAWIIYNGSIPNGLCVLHKCDNPPCCNPDHLFLGTRKDNAQDCSRKGRKEAMGLLAQKRMAKITPEQVAQIRAILKTGAYSQREIGEQYGLTANAISAIVTRRNWQNVP